MARLVSLSEKAYARLLKLKRHKETVFDVIVKLTDTKKNKSILRLAGVWKDSTEMDKIFKRIVNERHKTTYREKDTAW